MKKIVITGIIVIAALAGIVYVLNKHKAENTAQTEIVAQKNSFVAVRVETADFREINGEYIANGTFAPQQEVKISAETSGLVTKVLVNEGSHVSAGQTLAVIKSDQQNVNVANAQQCTTTQKRKLPALKVLMQLAVLPNNSWIR